MTANTNGTYLGRDKTGEYAIYAYIPRLNEYVRTLGLVNINQLRRVMARIQPDEPYSYYWDLPTKDQMLEVARLLQLNGFHVTGLYWTSSIINNQYTTVDVGSYPPRVKLINDRDRAKLLVVRYLKVQRPPKQNWMSKVHNWFNHILIEANGKQQDTLVK